MSPPKNPRTPQFIGLQEGADRCGVHYRTMRRWIADGRINAVRVGPRLLKARADDLDALLQPVGGAADELIAAAQRTRLAELLRPVRNVRDRNTVVAERLSELDGGAAG